MIRTASWVLVLAVVPAQACFPCDLDCPAGIRKFNAGSYGGWATDYAPNRSTLCFDEAGHVYVTFYERESAHGNGDIFVVRSSDFGLSWDLPVRVDTGDAPLSTDSVSQPVIACDKSGHVYVVWVDFRVPGAGIFINTSSDYGSTFEPVARLIDIHAGDAGDIRPFLALGEGGGVYLAWDDSRNGRRDVFFKASSDHGRTWMPGESRLDVYDLPGSGFTRVMSLHATDSGTLFVFWMEEYGLLDDGDGDVFVARSTDRGETWELPTRLSTDHAQGATAYAGMATPAVVQDEAIYVFYRTGSGGLYGYFYNVSLDGGATWFDQAERFGEGAYLSVAANGQGRIHAAWNEVPGDRILTSFSLDYGAPSSWSTPAAVSAAANSDRTNRAIGLDDDGVFVVYRDQDQGDPECYRLFVNRSCDAGSSWLAAPVDVDAGCGVEPYRSLYPYIASPGGDAMYLAWVRTDLQSLQSHALFRRIPDIQSILVDPGPYVVCPGDSVVLDGSRSATQACPAAAVFQWVEEGTDIPGATAATYVIPATLALGDHRYRLRVACDGWPQCSQTSDEILVTVVADAVPPDQGNVLRGVKETATATVLLDFTGAAAGEWRIFRDADKGNLGSTPLVPDVGAPAFSDTGVLYDWALYYYRIKGLSPCTKTPGP